MYFNMLSITLDEMIAVALKEPLNLYRRTDKDVRTWRPQASTCAFVLKELQPVGL